MAEKALIGIYDSLAKAEEAELLLEGIDLPVGQISVFAPNMEAGKEHGNVTEDEVAEAVATSGIHLSHEQVNEYKQALREGKLLLIFRGDDEMVTNAYHVLEHADKGELTVLAG